MARVITLHIGPNKTGTTTLQSILTQSRKELQSADVLYPLQRRSASQLAAAAGAFLTVPSSLEYVPRPLRELWLAQEQHLVSLWEDLVRRANDWPGEVIVSAEHFGYAPSELVRAILDRFPSTQVRVVSVVRPMSQLLPSWYQEEAKKVHVGDFEGFVRGVVTDVVRPGPSAYNWMQATWIADNWSSEVSEYYAVSTERGDLAEAIRETHRLLTGTELDPDRVTRRNSSLSAVGLEAWRSFLLTMAPKNLQAANKSRALAYRGQQVAYSSSQGGRFMIADEVAPVLDSLTPGDRTASAQINHERPLTRVIQLPSEAPALTRNLARRIRIAYPPTRSVYATIDLASLASTGRRRYSVAHW